MNNLKRKGRKMKKLIGLLMLAVMTVGLLNAQSINDFRGHLDVTPADADRAYWYDASAPFRSRVGYLLFSEVKEEVLQGEFVTVDTTVTGFQVDTLDIALGSRKSITIDLVEDDLLFVEYLYVEDGFGSVSLGFYNADSNGTRLDTINVCEDGARTNTFWFPATQDSTLYLMFSDTTYVDKRAFLRYTIFK
jgi:hypothetical protein